MNVASPKNKNIAVKTWFMCVGAVSDTTSPVIVSPVTAKAIAIAKNTRVVVITIFFFILCISVLLVFIFFLLFLVFSYYDCLLVLFLQSV